MNIVAKIVILLAINIATSCNTKLPDENDCQITEYRDESLKGRNNITRLDFYCDSNTERSHSYDLALNNPYRELGFPVITESTKYFKVGKYHSDLRKTGNISFNLEGIDFEKINEKIPHELPHGLTNYDFELALTRCSVNLVSSKQAIVNYYISLHGYKHQRKVWGVLFLGGRLYVLNEFGNSDYEVFAENFAITYPHIIPEKRLLIFRTTEMTENLSKDGFEIHDIQGDSIRYDFKFGTTNLVKYPIAYTSEYVVFQITEGHYNLKEIFLYDLEEDQFYQKTFNDGYDFFYSKIDDFNIILQKVIETEHGVNSAYDTLRITDLNKYDK